MVGVLFLKSSRERVDLFFRKIPSTRIISV